MILTFVFCIGLFYFVYKDYEDRCRSKEVAPVQNQIPWNVVEASANAMLSDAINNLTLGAYHINAISYVCLMCVSNHPNPLCFRFPLNNQKGVSNSALLRFQADLNSELYKINQLYHTKLVGVNLPISAIIMEDPVRYNGLMVENVFVFNGYVYMECVSN